MQIIRDKTRKKLGMDSINTDYELKEFLDMIEKSRVIEHTCNLEFFYGEGKDCSYCGKSFMLEYAETHSLVLDNIKRGTDDVYSKYNVWIIFIARCPNRDCQRPIIWVHSLDQLSEGGHSIELRSSKCYKLLAETLLFPQINKYINEKFKLYVNSDILEDYMWAKDAYENGNYNGSCFHSGRSLDNIFVNKGILTGALGQKLGQLQENPNISKELNDRFDKLESILGARNIGSHPNLDSNNNLIKCDAEMAAYCLRTLEKLFTAVYVDPAEDTKVQNLIASKCASRVR